MLAHEADAGFGHLDRLQRAADQRGVGAAEAEEVAPGMQQRRAVGLLRGDGERAVVRGQWQPWRVAGGEAAMRAVMLPRHRRAAAVAAAELGPVGDAERVLHVLWRDL